MRLKIFDYNHAAGTLPGGCYIKTKSMKPLKSKPIKQLRDGQHFRLSNRKGAVTYSVQRKSKGKVWYTSLASERTYSLKGHIIVFVN